MAYLLFGMGKSNQSIKRYFDNNNIDYCVYDDKTKDNIDFNKIDYIIKTPGVALNHHLLANKQEKIMMELELFNKYKDKKSKVDIVTGTNGKTTVLKMIEEVCGYRCIGNNGKPLFDYVTEINHFVIEASSFMGEKPNNLKVSTAIILNIYPSHLERHGNINEYINAKENLIKNADTLIINKDNKYTRKLIRKYKRIKKIYTYSTKKRKADLILKDNIIYYHNISIIDIRRLPEYLQMYKENTLATILYAIIEYSFDKIKELENFKSLDHRYEIVSSKPKIINDSKSTNFYALRKALEVTKEELILICGGKIKEEDYSQIKGFKNVKKVLICGENRFLIAQIVSYPYKTYKNLSELLNDLPNEYDGKCTLLFSPGSISYDQFSSFEERGEFFKKKINEYLKNR